MKKAFLIALAAIVVAGVAVAGALRAREASSSKEIVLSDGDSPKPNNSKRVPVIVELFTSEGCSSCPPADDLLVLLEKTQPIAGVEVIPLAHHVDYWNYLGWSDPFSSAESGARQRAYAQKLGKDGVYTPQMVVDGTSEFVGSKRAKANEQIARAARNVKLAVQLALIDDSNRDIVRLRIGVGSLPATLNGRAIEVLLAITESELSTDVARGENAGNKLNHAAVVRSLNVIGQAKSGEETSIEQSIPLQPAWRRAHMRAVGFLQDPETKQIYGAATLKLGGA